MTTTFARICLVSAVAVSAIVATAAADDEAPVVEAAPTAQRVLLVSDSVGLGTRGVLQTAFPADWEVNVIGTPAMFVEQLEASHVVPTIVGAPSLVGDHVVIAGGYNYPYWDPERFDRSIDAMIARLTNAGVKHVYWVTLREVKPQFITASAWRQVQPYYWYFPTVNEHLQRAVARHPNLQLVDWAAAADRSGITYDAIHLNRTGAELYSSLIADAVDTNSTRPLDGTITKVDVTDDPDVAAVALNLAATKTRHTGYFTAFDCSGTPPEAANLNYVRGDTVSGAAIVPVDDTGSVCVFNSTASHVVIDVFGTFGGDSGLTDVPPNRAFDSRLGGRPEQPGEARQLKVSAPGAAAVALNITGINAAGTGYITAHPCDVEPATATVNLRTGETTPNLVVVAPDEAGNVCVTVTGTSTHLTVDRFATFTNGDAIATIEPARAYDSRDVTGARAATTTHRISLADTPIDDPESVEALFLNLAIVRADGAGFATAWPCRESQPGTANVNFAPGDTVSNFVTVAPDTEGEICIVATTGADVVVDVLGSARAGFDGFTPRRLLDTRS
ncbi:MAG: hypothetical protein ACE37B_05180 [Ilumatobacter sp.]|uniref:hypothetical protein n=1 Tax=Ilumatobacter sp. TaxID=1967498 RepID=UPI0039191B4B